MYIFGGKNDENTKLNDTWKFSLKTFEWTCVQTHIEKMDDEHLRPVARSGHASQVYKDCMIIYGGILEVTKELNDMHIFDFKKEKWVVMFAELNSPQNPVYNNMATASPNSVALKRSITKN